MVIVDLNVTKCSGLMHKPGSEVQCQINLTEEEYKGDNWLASSGSEC